MIPAELRLISNTLELTNKTPSEKIRSALGLGGLREVRVPCLSALEMSYPPFLELLSLQV